MKKTFYALFLVPLFLFSQKKEIAFKTFTLNPNSCNGFQCSSGSLIFVPDNAFLTEEGVACAEKVTIKYREFHSQTDMFYAGINMIFDDNGKYRILESAGMFEIQAFCGEKKLTLKDGKSIQVRMKTRRNLPDLKSFIYDPIKNTWSKYGSMVVDFSYLAKNNKSDSTNLWGSSKIVPQSAQIMDGDGQVFKTEDFSTKLPEGFFKGMNIKKLGLFNYDGVIKEALAVPMIPEFFVKQDGSKIEQKIYVVYLNKNCVVYYTPENFAEQFVLLKAKGTRIFTEFTDGSMACTNSVELDKLNLESYRKKAIKISLEKLPIKPKTEKELVAATGLNNN